MWLLGLESVASLIWVFCLACSIVLTVLNLAVRPRLELFGVGLAWGVAISIVATIQLVVAVALRQPYDHWGAGAMLLGPLYPLLFWIVSASAAVDQQITALIRGPRERAGGVGHPTRTARLHQPVTTPRFWTANATAWSAPRAGRRSCRVDSPSADRNGAGSGTPTSVRTRSANPGLQQLAEIVHDTNESSGRDHDNRGVKSQLMLDGFASADA